MSRIETTIHLREIAAHGKPVLQEYRAWIEDQNSNGLLYDDPLVREDGTVFSVGEIQLYRMMYLSAGGAPTKDSFSLYLDADRPGSVERLADIFVTHPDTYAAIGADEREPLQHTELLEYILFDFADLDTDTPLYDLWLDRLVAGSHNQGGAVLGIVESNEFIASTFDEVAKLEFSSFIACFNDENDDGLLYDASIELGGGTVLSAEEAQLYRLYLGAMERVPETDGFFWWLEKMRSGEKGLVDVAEGFTNSTEMMQLMDTDQDGAVAHSELLNHLYGTVLGRTPDQAGWNWWMQELDSAAKDQAEVLNAFVQSNEFAQATLQIVGDYQFMDLI